MRKTLSLVLCVGALACSGVLLMYTTASAQFSDVLSSGSGATLRFDPPFPESGQEVTITLESGTFNAVGANIQWFINGAEDPARRNARAITLTTPGAGEQTPLRVRITTQNGSRDINAVLTPRNVDLVVEANTIAPAFYEGKALPSAGSIARVVAIPHFQENPASLFYTWRVDNEVQRGGAIQGQQSIEIPLANGTERIVSVAIESSSGALLARKSMALDAVDPEIHFYEQSPLRGTQEISEQGEFVMESEEVGIAAIPYFMSLSTRNTQNAEHTWRIGGRKITNPSVDPFFIALRGSGGGATTLSFRAQSLEDFLQRTEADVRIIFGQ